MVFHVSITRGLGGIPLVSGLVDPVWYSTTFAATTFAAAGTLEISKSCFRKVANSKGVFGDHSTCE
jgi:hypothetical protein